MSKLKKLLCFATALLALFAAGCSCKNGSNILPEVDPSILVEPPDDDSGFDPEVVIDDLAENGQTQYTLVYAADMSKVAAEFCNYFKTSTGATLTARADDSEDKWNKDDKYVSIGGTALLKASGVDEAYKYTYEKGGAVQEVEREKIDYSDMNGDGFFIRTLGKSLFINGANVRGVMYGCYDFLELSLGVRFVAHDETYIPEHKTLALNPYTRIQKPLHEYRHVWTADTVNNAGGYMSHMRMNGNWRNVGIDGNTLQFVGGGGVSSQDHNSTEWINPSAQTQAALGVGTEDKLLLTTHPELFSRDIFGNPRLSNGATGIRDICFSSGINTDGTVKGDPAGWKDWTWEELKDEWLTVKGEVTGFAVARRTLLRILEGVKTYNPDARFIQFGSNDVFYRVCNCALCSAGAQKYGELGLQIRFVNPLADIIAKFNETHPGIQDLSLSLFAYNFSAPPPALNSDDTIKEPTAKPRDNVVPYIAISSGNYGGYWDLSYRDAKQESKLTNVFNAWVDFKKKGHVKDVMMWDYGGNHNNYLLYYNPARYLRKQMLEVNDLKPIYYWLQENCSTEAHLPIMSAYMLSKLYWNPNLNPVGLRDEFIRLYYGPAAEYVIEYHDRFDMNLEIYGASHFNGNDRTNGYSQPFLLGQILLLDKGIADIENSSLSLDRKNLLIKRVRNVRLQVKYLYGRFYDDWSNDAVAKALYRSETCDDAEELNWTNYGWNIGTGATALRVHWKA